MDDVHARRRANLKALLDDQFEGNQSRLAQVLDVEPSYISNLLGARKGFGERIARRIEAAVKLPRGRLDEPPAGLRAEDAAAPYGAAAGFQLNIPVVGTAQLGDEGYWDELQHPPGNGDGFIPHPTKDRNAYALRVKGDSMRPRIKPGEFVIVEPNTRVEPGDEVLVKTSDGRSMVKLLASHRNGLVELRSVNEDHPPITLDEAQVVALHFVAGIVKVNLYRHL